MKIGNILQENVSVGFFTGNLKMQHQSLLGADLMKRFNWVFNVNRDTAYIQPSNCFNAVYTEIK